MRTLTLSAIPLTASRTSDRKKLRDSPKPMMHSANIATARAAFVPRAGRAAMREIDRRHDAPAAGAARRMPESLRADVENLIGEHREQRLGAAEQHGEEIERERREQHRLAEHEAQARTRDSSPIDSSRRRADACA